MSIEKNVEAVIEKQIRQGNKNFIIYPFGVYGRLVKRILNTQYGIDEKFIVDEKYSEYNPHIKNVNAVIELCNYGYKWLVAVENSVVRKAIVDCISLNADASDIIDIFSELEKNKANKVFDETFPFLSQMNDSTVFLPCKEFVNIVDGLKRQNRKLSIAEVGIGYGATAVEVCGLLGEKDEYYCFDFQKSVDGLISDLRKMKNIACQLKGYGNSTKTWDSYCWGLSDLIYEMRDNGQDGIFDAIYLDGSHAFPIDGLACCLLKELCKQGGYIVFDDMEWTWENYEDIAKKLFTTTQMKECQVSRVVNMFMLRDERFERVLFNDNFRPSREIFYKRFTSTVV